MLRVNWRVIVAIAGLVLIGIGPSKQSAAQSQNNNSANAVTSERSSADFADPEQPVTPSPDQGCKRGQDDRKSDLCAQWKAADAAYDGAKWTWWQLWIGVAGLILGAVTMVAAIAAAVYAKRAAVATESTVSIAQEAAKGADSALAIASKNADAAVKLADQAEANARRQLRAYLSAGEVSLTRPLRNEVLLHIDVRNDGTTPAHITGLYVSIWWRNEKKEAVCPDQIDEKLEMIIAPSQTDTLTLCVGMGPENPVYTQIKSLMVSIIVHYRDVFEEDQHIVFSRVFNNWTANSGSLIAERTISGDKST
jgi:hypothetical protein